MKPFQIFFILMWCLTCCSEPPDNEKKYFPSHKYQFVETDTSNLYIKKDIYVPIYSDIYHISGLQKVLLTSTLSIRNIGFNDSIYVYKIDYYDSYGKLIKKYINRTLLVKPMESLEFVVGDKDNEGGTGANFVVQWGAKSKVNEPVIQAVMIGSYNQLGISFTTEGKEILK